MSRSTRAPAPASTTHDVETPGCGTYYRLENRRKAQLTSPHRKRRIAGNTHPLCALRSSRLPRFSCFFCRPSAGLERHGRPSTQALHFYPLRANAFAHASSVAPVVFTSSTSKTRRLSTWLPGCVAKAPRTDSRHWRNVSRCLSGHGRFLTSNTTPSGGNLIRFARRLEGRSARLEPRSRQRSFPSPVNQAEARIAPK